MLSSLPLSPQRTVPGAAMLRRAQPALLVLAAHLGLLWLATQMHALPVPISTPPVPPTVMLALLESAPPPPLPATSPHPAAPVRTVPLRPTPMPHPRQAVAPAPAMVTSADTSSAPSAPAAPASAPEAAAAPVTPAAPMIRPPVITSGVQYLTAPQPVYPAAARRRGDEGEVLLRVLINAQGGVEQIALERSSGIASLDQAAREAVQRARFQPYVEQGRALPAYVVVPIKFQLTQ
ncbi:energy transducer TonB [Herbaspirillum huttiense]|uniref:energy transducer TonB n=1 Tax=Herbaspirillum huttiense TaxID=863372 RepID=UPI0010664DF4|nr:energy transducer TonB [Herbaspirillum huttiense]QBP76507.1 energy transducer TonB [Herbaspirillum huttiense]